MRLLAVLLLSSALGAFAAEEPDAVYARFHRAIASRDLNEALRYAPAARRAEVNAMSPAQKDAQVKMMGMLIPRAFTLMSKTVAPDGKSARLIVTGPGEALGDGKPETMYGTIRMMIEGGEWKVDELSWSNEKPSGAMQAGRPATRPAADVKAAAKAAPAPAPAAEKPLRVLGPAKAECVFKPVMTNEDLERCR